MKAEGFVVALFDVSYKKLTSKKNIRHQIFRAARLQNEIAPEKCLNRYEKRYETRTKNIRKTIRNVTEQF